MGHSYTIPPDRAYCLAGEYKRYISAVLQREQPPLPGGTHHSSLSGEMESPQAHSLLGAASLRIPAEADPTGVHAGNGIPLHVDQ